MDSIKDISALAHNLKKLEKQTESRKVETKKDTSKTDQNKTVGLNQDKAEISDTARSLLNVKTEATRYVSLVENTKIIDDEELEEIREKVMTNYYSEKEVINQITEKLLNLPNYISKADEAETQVKDNDDDQKQLNT